MYVSKRQLSRVKRRRLFIIGLGLALVAALIAGIVLLARNAGSSGSVRSLTVLPFTQSEPYAVTGEAIYYIKDGILHALDKNGSEAWYQQFTNKDLQVTADENCVIVYNSVAMQVLDLKGAPLMTREFAGEVIKIASGPNRVGVLKHDIEGGYMLHMFDFAGTELNRLTFTGENMLNFDFARSALLNFYALSLDSNSALPISKISTYNDAFALTSVVTLEQQLVQSICYTDAGLFIAGTHNLYQYETQQGTKLNETLIYGWTLMDTYVPDTGEPVHVFAHTGATEDGTLMGSIRIITLPGEETLLQLPAECIKVVLGNNKLYCITRSAIHSYSFNGVPLTTDTFAQPIDAVQAVYKGSRIIVASGDELYACTLP